jgi:ankyrin repeat protein
MRKLTMEIHHLEIAEHNLFYDISIFLKAKGAKAKPKNTSTNYKSEFDLSEEKTDFAELANELNLLFKKGDLDKIQSILAKDILLQKDEDGKTLLHIACEENYFELIQFLVEKKINIDVADNMGYTPLLIASSTGNLKLFKYFTSA